MESPSPRTQKFDLMTLSILGASVVLVMCICVGGVAAVLRGPLGTTLAALFGQSANNAVAIIPAEAPLFVTLTATGPQFANLQALQSRFEAVPEVKESLEGYETGLDEEQDFNFEEDIQPWIGPELAMALVSSASVSASNTLLDSDVVFALSTRDQAQSDIFIQKRRDLAQKEGATVAEKEHAGVKYTAINHPANSAGDNLFITTVDNFVVLASMEPSLHKVIDLSQGQGGQALGSQPTYQEAINALPQDRIGQVYMNIGPLVKEWSSALPMEPLPAQQAQLESVKAVAGAFRLASNGVAVDTVTIFDVAKLDAAQQALLQQAENPLTILGAFPVNSLFVWTMRDLKTMWEASTAQMASDPLFTQSVEGFEKSMGLSVKDDIVGWMTGEVGLVLFEDKGGFMNNPAMPVGGLLVVEATNRAVVEEKVKKLSGVLEKQGITFTPQTIGGVQMQVLDEQLGGLGYGFVGNFFVLGTSATSLTTATESKNSPFTNAPHYQAVSAALPGSRTNMMYVNIEEASTVMDALSETMGTTEMTENNVYLRPIKAFGMSSEPLAGSQIKSHFFLLIP